MTAVFEWIIAYHRIYEPQHEISNNAVCATSRASDQTARLANAGWLEHEQVVILLCHEKSIIGPEN